MPSLAVNGSATLMLVGQVASTGVSITNTAEVVGVDQFDPDSKPNNNVGDEDDQISASDGACLTSSPLVAGINRFSYSCVTPGGFASFVMGTQPGSHFFDKWNTTVDIADSDAFAIGVGNIDGVATVLLELTPQQANQDFLFQAFEMLPNPHRSNILVPNTSQAVVGVPLRADEVGLAEHHCRPMRYRRCLLCRSRLTENCRRSNTTLA